MENLVADSVDDSDQIPEVQAVEGMVFFTPRVPIVHYRNLSVQPDEVVAFVEESILTRHDAPSVTLLASADPLANPSLWSYDVRFELYTVEGTRVHIPSGRIVVFPEVQTNLSVALTKAGGFLSGSFTASPYVWADPNEPVDPQPGTWWLNTTTGDLKEWVA